MSIIQDSDVGPALYVITESDLKLKSSRNSIFRYDDETNFMVPECTDIYLLEEFDNVKQWASANKMHINQA